MITTDYERCTGCGACVQKCPQKCIEWVPGEFGFKYPKLDESQCVDCGLCDKVCPIGKSPARPETQTVYALVNKNKSVLMNSTSGGAFSALAENILNDGGVVYGCAMMPNFQVQHIRIDKVSDIARLRGAKYIQSDTKNVFTQVRIDLKEGRKVLFASTPCQIAGLQSYLGKNHENLLTIDLVCHGIVSQKYFDRFIDWVKLKKGDIERIEFRNKKFVGWSSGGLITINGRDVPLYNYTNYYYSYFLSGEIYRKSCYSCQYANMNRVGDITLGDFWGVERLNIAFDTSQGCSLVIANTVKGKEMINSLHDVTEIQRVEILDAIRNNKQLSASPQNKSSRDDRLKEYEELSVSDIQKIYVKTHIGRIIKGKLKTILPYSVKLKLRKII